MTSAVAVPALLAAAAAALAFQHWRHQRSLRRISETVPPPPPLPAEAGALQERLRELEVARAKAEESNEAKNEYLAQVSHELRTPLGGIIGMTQVALDSELTPEQRACIETAHSSAQSLLRVINDILDFSKIEARKLDLQAIHFDLHDRITEVVKSFGVAAQKKGLELALDIAPGVPHNVVGDDGRLRQVLVNLLGNAVKFTGSGEVVVQVKVANRTRQDVLVHTSVRDTGKGIPAGKEQSIFRAYEQADLSISRQYGGTGLGLSIAARLVELMGGRIWAENNADGPGSTFHFTIRLWLQRLARVEPRPVLPPSDAKQRALVVEHQRSTRKILKSMLEAWDLEVETASNEAEALRLMAETQLGARGFAFVLIAGNLEGGDGFQLAEAVRRNPQLPGSVVMILPSPGDFGGAARCRQMQLASYVTKPVSAAELADAITRALHAPIPVMRSAPLPMVQLSTRPRRILIVEDEPVNRELAESYLRRWGHTVVVATDALEAIDRLNAGAIEAILMDLQMPGMTGLELTRAIRSGSEERSAQNLPIIGFSARASREDKIAAIEAGMNDYVGKPLDPAELFAAFERAAPSVDAAGGEDSEAGAAAEEILARVDGNADLARRIITVFLKDTPGLMKELRAAVDKQDAEATAALAHRLKGAASNFPFEDAVALAAKTEILARRNTLGALDEVCEQLENEIDEAMLTLQLVLVRIDTADRG